MRTFAFNNTSLLKKDRGSHNVSASAFHLLHIVIQTVNPHVSTELSVSADLLFCCFQSRNMIPFFEREVFTGANLRKNRYIILVFWRFIALRCKVFLSNVRRFNRNVMQIQLVDCVN